MNRMSCLPVALAVLLTASAAAQENLDSLIRALKTGNSDVVGKTQEELAKIGRPAAEPLYALIREENEKAKDKLASTFAQAVGGKISTARRLQTEAKQHDVNMSRAFETLAKIGSPAIEVLVKALNDGESRYRRAVLDSLVTIGDKSAVTPLRAFAEQQPSARDEVLKAVEKLEGPNK